MEVPSNIKNVGWYNRGPYPGATGSAVIAGHLNGLKGEPGSFIDLKKMQKGDSLSVLDDKGQSISFTVRATQSYGQNEKHDEVFNSSQGSHLNLITCVGAWDSTQHRYTKRLVVFTERSQ